MHGGSAYASVKVINPVGINLSIGMCAQGVLDTLLTLKMLSLKQWVRPHKHCGSLWCNFLSQPLANSYISGIQNGVV